MPDFKQGEDAYLGQLREGEKRDFYKLPREKQHKIVEQSMLQHQDDEMWEKNEGISQLEGRMATHSFQG